MQHAGSCHCGRIAFELETDAPITEGANPKTGQATIAVNVRCITGLDLTTRSVQRIDGASL
ncbi:MULTISPECIES: hypothetical protein [Xanthomonas]|uniref:Aldehyde-activating protein n=1 Tax=Xanthomonas cucurbitae TaxID=56453 RepID=A0A2S7DPU8_9XANT|nr:hypothetical protein [Xanthomonas cucurbitae]PPU75851.1 hypothetical protein XcuCFBP2542_12620 [Xanthomonas cucurbitae]QHG87560.1 hypothetical protein EBN15_12010 [Xanthomonas cucurbitae]WDM66427.1 hypothetical protein K6981_12795 [Xanthomonas cucurbitae]WDM70305.1 hypothetical protein K6978_12765 [Xanthomonas cucurbitae]WDM74173.1 hypothetical protein K6982_12085 [Xanthomonas cucurbitae]